MTLTILLFVLFAVGFIFIIRALFNQEWRNNAQAKIDAIKQQRILLRLVKGYGGLNLGVDAIVTVHLDPRHLATYLGSVSDVGKRTDDDERVLKLLSKKNILESIQPLNAEFERADKTIQEALRVDETTFTKAEIQKIFVDYKEDRIFLPDQYDRFVELYQRLFPNHEPLEGEHKKTWEELEGKGAFPEGWSARFTSGKYSKTDIWKARKKLEETAGRLEWKTDELKEDAATVFAIRKSEAAIGEVLGGLLCGTDAKNTPLRKALTDWENIQMLRSCIVDLIAPWHGTSGIPRFMWKVIAEIAG